MSIAVGVLVLASWGLDVDDRLPMKPFTALCFVLIGVGLRLHTTEPSSARPLKSRRRYVVAACAATVLLIGGLMVLEYLLRVDLGIDGLLFHDALVAAEAVNLGRMSLATSLCIACFGLGLC